MQMWLRAVCLGVVLPGAVGAEEAGKITAEIDGTQRVWSVITVTRGDESMISASFNGSNRLASLSLQGHPEPRFTTTDVLSVEGMWFGGYSADKPVTDVEIIFMPEGMSNPFYTSDQVPEQATITLDTLDVGETEGRATGSFSGKICRVAKLYEEPDLDDCINLSGTFDTAIQIR